jgi:NADH:ubiquinone oxidoreductase subunit E
MTKASTPCGDGIPCGEENKRKFAELDQYIDDLNMDLENPRRMDTLIMTLHQAQKIFGFLPEVVQVHISKRYAVPHAHVSGVISFYNYFTTTPKGKVQINVCMGTACYVNGADKVLQEFEQVLGIKTGEVTEDGKFSIESLRCVGACGLAPVVTINSKVYGKVKVGDVRDILEKYLIEETATVEVDNA